MRTPETDTPVPVRTPRADLHSTDDALLVLMDLPGVRADDLTVRLDRGLLFIEGIERDDEGAERRRNRRAIALQRRVDADGIEARLRDGVLTLRLPRLDADRPRSIAVVEA
jgi:HSP20 family protein